MWTETRRAAGAVTAAIRCLLRAPGPGNCYDLNQIAHIQRGWIRYPSENNITPAAARRAATGHTRSLCLYATLLPGAERELLKQVAKAKQSKPRCLLPGPGQEWLSSPRQTPIPSAHDQLAQLSVRAVSARLSSSPVIPSHSIAQGSIATAPCIAFLLLPPSFLISTLTA